MVSRHSRYNLSCLTRSLKFDWLKIIIECWQTLQDNTTSWYAINKYNLSTRIIQSTNFTINATTVEMTLNLNTTQLQSMQSNERNIHHLIISNQRLSFSEFYENIKSQWTTIFITDYAQTISKYRNQTWNENNYNSKHNTTKMSYNWAHPTSRELMRRAVESISILPTS